MEDVENDLKEKICIFCYEHKCKNCMDLQFEKQGNLKIYRCLNFKKGKIMNQFKEYINYTFYDETNHLVAIVYENTPADVIKELQKEYDEVKYSEN